MSAYTCLREVVKTIVGSIGQYLVADRFRNIDLIKNVNSPTFIIHGQRDNLIPYSHS